MSEAFKAAIDEVAELLKSRGHTGTVFGSAQELGDLQMVPVAEVVLDLETRAGGEAAGEAEEASPLRARLRVTPLGFLSDKGGEVAFTPVGAEREERPEAPSPAPEPRHEPRHEERRDERREERHEPHRRHGGEWGRGDERGGRGHDRGCDCGHDDRRWHEGHGGEHGGWRGERGGWRGEREGWREGGRERGAPPRYREERRGGPGPWDCGPSWRDCGPLGLLSALCRLFPRRY